MKIKGIERQRIRMNKRARRSLFRRLSHCGIDEDHMLLLVRIHEGLDRLAVRAGAPPGIRGLRDTLLGLYEMDDNEGRELWAYLD